VKRVGEKIRAEDGVTHSAESIFVFHDFLEGNCQRGNIDADGRIAAHWAFVLANPAADAPVA
jgi:hypothetical protein